MKDHNGMPSVRSLSLRIVFVSMSLFLAACMAPSTTLQTESESQPASGSSEDRSVQQLEKNQTDGCVENYDASVDYFPEKIELAYAEGLTVDYFNNYKVVQVLNPWRGAEETFEYVLVQCGTPAPERFENGQVIEIPVKRFVALSTTILPGIDELRLLDRLVAVEEFDYVNTESIRALIDNNTVAEVSDGGAMNVEMVLAQEPDLVMTFAYGSPEWDAHPKLLEAGVDTAITAGYMESSPLGRSEWMKFTALFFNREAEAEALFAEKAKRYQELAVLTANISERPTVLTGVNRGDAWRVSGGNSYFAQLLDDAGADYLWASDMSTGSIPLDFEQVIDVAADADFWVPNTGGWITIDDVLAADERYREFAAVDNGAVINNNASVNEFGGNDYFEQGVANPDMVLADLISFFHPDLLPDHQSTFFLQIDE